MSPITPLDRDLGRHDAQIEGLQRDLSALREDVHAMRRDIGEMAQTISQAKGGWKALASVGILSGGFGAFISKVFAQT